MLLKLKAPTRERERESKRLRRFVKFLFSFFFVVIFLVTVSSSVYAATGKVYFQYSTAVHTATANSRILYIYQEMNGTNNARRWIRSKYYQYLEPPTFTSGNGVWDFMESEIGSVFTGREYDRSSFTYTNGTGDSASWADLNNYNYTGMNYKGRNPDAGYVDYSAYAQYTVQADSSNLYLGYMTISSLCGTLRVKINDQISTTGYDLDSNGEFNTAKPLTITAIALPKYIHVASNVHAGDVVKIEVKNYSAGGTDRVYLYSIVEGSGDNLTPGDTNWFFAGSRIQSDASSDYLAYYTGTSFVHGPAHGHEYNPSITIKVDDVNKVLDSDINKGDLLVADNVEIISTSTVYKTTSGVDDFATVTRDITWTSNQFIRNWKLDFTASLALQYFYQSMWSFSGTGLGSTSNVPFRYVALGSSGVNVLLPTDNSSLNTPVYFNTGGNNEFTFFGGDVGLKMRQVSSITPQRIFINSGTQKVYLLNSDYAKTFNIGESVTNTTTTTFDYESPSSHDWSNKILYITNNSSFGTANELIPFNAKNATVKSYANIGLTFNSIAPNRTYFTSHNYDSGSTLNEIVSSTTTPVKGDWAGLTITGNANTANNLISYATTGLILSSNANSYNNSFFQNTTGINAGNGSTVQNNALSTCTTYTTGAGTFNYNAYTGNSETNGVSSDPSFTNAASGNYLLTSNSPAINTGTDLSSLFTTDYVGNTRPQGTTFDIGGYEYLVPSSPSSLLQYESDGSTSIAVGSGTDNTSVVLKFVMSSDNVSESLTPQVELREIGTAFTNSVTHSGNAVAYSGSEVTGTVTITGLTLGKKYHWQARVSNSSGQSSWVSFGGNNESVSDFQTDITNPTATSLSSPTGYTKDNTKPTLVFKKASDSGSGIASYSVSLDDGKNKNYSTSGIPATGNGTSNYVLKDDSSVKVTFVNENDSDAGNDEIQVYFKGLDTAELYEGKHTWTVTTYDTVSNSTSTSADFYIDKTSPTVSELAIANVSIVFSGVSYNLDITNRMPSFSGLVADSYQGSTITNSNGTKDTFDKVSSGPQTLTLTFKKQKSDQTYADYSTKDFSLSDIQDTNGDKKSSRFYITTPFPLVDGYYQVTIVLKDSTGNSYSQPTFYIALNASKTTTSIQNLFTNNLETKIINQETVPATNSAETKQVQENGYTVKVKVVDTQNKPVVGAKVTIHSKVQETITDKDGLAIFNNVEQGEHRVLIAYSGYTGEQKVNLTGDVKEFDFNIQVKQTNAFLNPQVIGVIGVLVLALVATVILLLRAKKKVT